MLLRLILLTMGCSRVHVYHKPFVCILVSSLIAFELIRNGPNRQSQSEPSDFSIGVEDDGIDQNFNNCNGLSVDDDDDNEDNYDINGPTVQAHVELVKTACEYCITCYHWNILT